ncbi:hypothetical protein IscW_ISCW022043 [Ixodes scapularis]|uniref:Uncharacterized protein n=1 Tax=Ixodes scapularis TaxID=6945 RepID=B7QD20_IXOSC|nr:hypothetical protein IscW_ISCW022043 [Ixodes scapularis]|eukprot:XP_002413435.1 hypothetical protein IscW_ISCW022043 [Ixodes scapularis]
MNATFPVLIRNPKVPPYGAPAFLFLRHKKKVQNFLPCKSQHQGACDLSSANGGAYSDILLNHHHPTRLPNHLGHGPDTHTLTPIELLDVKYGSYGAPHLTPLTQTNYTFRPTVRPQDHQQRPAGSTLHGGGHHVGGGGGRRSAPGTSQRAHHHKPSRTGTASSRRSHRSNSEQFNPIYEEVSGRAKSRRNYRGHHRDSEDSEVEEVDARSLASEDEFAEDELSLGEYPRLPESGSSSLQGSTGGDLCPPDSSSHLDRPPSRRLRGVAATSSGKHSHSLERNRNNSTGLQAKHNYYLSKSALAFDQRNLDPTGAYSSVDLVQPSPPPEPAPSGLFGAGYPLAGSSSGFMVGPDCQYPPVPANPGTFSTFLVPSAAQEDVGDGAAAAENIYASIDDEDSAGPYTIGGVRGTSKAPGLQGQLGKTPMGGRTLSAKEAPSYGDIRPVFPGGAADQNRTLCT